MEPIFRTTASTDWITLVLLLSLVFLILAKATFYHRFMNFLILPFNNKYISMYNKKERLFNWFNMFMGLFQLLNLALFLYFSWAILKEPMGISGLLSFLIVLMACLVFIMLKTMLQLGNGFIFGSYSFFNELVYKKLTYLNYGALVLFAANIILNYVLTESKVVIYLAFALFLSINLMGWYTVIKNFQKTILHHFFYFILYLCALEIAPLIILGNLLK